MTDEATKETSLTDPAAAVITQPDNSAQDRVLAKLRDMDATIQAQAAQIEELRKPKAEPVNAEAEKQKFWVDPLPLLRKELQEAVAPLVEFRDQFRADSLYDKIKNEFKNTPKFKEFLAAPGVEQYVDQIMASNKSITDEKAIRNAFQSAVLGIRGAMEMGLVDKPATIAPVATEQTKEQTKVETMIPPHLRPSSAPRPSGEAKNKELRPLTELEERLRRENKLTHAEFVELADETPPQDVIKWKPESQRTKEGAK